MNFRLWYPIWRLALIDSENTQTTADHWLVVVILISTNMGRVKSCAYTLMPVSSNCLNWSYQMAIIYSLTFCLTYFWTVTDYASEYWMTYIPGRPCLFILVRKLVFSLAKFLILRLKFYQDSFKFIFSFCHESSTTFLSCGFNGCWEAKNYFRKQRKWWWLNIFFN